ncbi:transposase [Streptomyces sp. NBC_01017]|nr:transposase [Streptomyces sp. NBC_01017]WSV34765.1 transposase [Streptomyces sp. NBC_01017]
MIPGRPYSFVAAPQPGRTSWTAELDVARPRLRPRDDEITVTAVQVRGVFQRLYVAGKWQGGAPPVLIVVDAGCDLSRLAFLLADLPVELPVELLGRMRSERVVYFPPLPQPAGKRGCTPKRGAEFTFEDPATQPVPSVTTLTDTTHYGKADATAVLTACTHCWSGARPGPTTLKDSCRSSKTPSSVFRSTIYGASAIPGRFGCGGQSPAPPPGMWTGSGRRFLRRFGLEHTFRVSKQTLGWTTPELREPAAADHWTWLVSTS